MPIVVSHQPAFDVVGKSAYSIGTGTKRERDAIRAEQNAFKQSQLNIQAASVAGTHQRGMASLAQRAKESEQRAGQFDREAALREAALDFRQDQYANEPGRALEMGMIQKELMQDKVKWQYNEQQKRDLEKINNGIAWVRQQVTEGKWTPEQAEQAEQQLWKRYHSIVPMPQYDDTPTAQEAFDKMSFVDSVSGKRMVWDGQSKFTEIGEKESITFDAYAKLYSQLVKSMQTFDDDGYVNTDPTVIATTINGLINSYNNHLAGNKDAQVTEQAGQEEGIKQIGVKSTGKKQVDDLIQSTALPERTKSVLKSALEKPEGFIKFAHDKFGRAEGLEMKIILNSGNQALILKALEKLGVI